ncbi:MAG: enoyl-[acyl-carrier-protein] reductase [NADH] [marine bacterium B5-7]|nr:MAG: enoyl-[acyl-carrier-protein] reductase [NADH] [marine bacterium B5-7]
MGFLTGKRALITGVASTRSIAYGIAQAMHREGAEVALTYQNEKLKPRAEKMAAELGSTLTFPCDVSNDAAIESMYAELSKSWDKIDIIIHSIAFAPADQLDGDYLDCVTREGFLTAHEISSYSFAALAKYGRPFLREGGALLTLTYLGSQYAIPNYNVMGLAKASLEANVRFLAASLGPQKVRVNAVSAGPIRTLAASGIAGFRKMLDANERVVPMRENVTTEQVGNVSAFLCSDLAAGVTGEVLHVDGGYHAIKMTEVMEHAEAEA